MKKNVSLQHATLILVSMLIGAFVGGSIIYNRVALRYRRQYETLYLVGIQKDLFWGKKLHQGETDKVIKRCDVFLGRSALGLRKEVTHVSGVSHALWAIKMYYRDYQIPTDAELENVFKQIPDEEPNETMGTTTDR